MRSAEVDETGRFTLRAAPGENFPYFVNTRGVRMAWDTRHQPPVLVKDGETTSYNMLITPEVSPEEKLKAARKLVESLSEQPSDRTAQILLEFRKLNYTVDETEIWCLLMRELVAIGRDATPQLCAELDRTQQIARLDGGRQEDHTGRTEIRRAHRLDAAHLGHCDIEQQNVGLSFACNTNGVEAIRRFGDNAEAGLAFEQPLEPITKNLMVVGDGDANLAWDLTHGHPR